MSFCDACLTAKFTSSRAPFECEIGILLAPRQVLPSSGVPFVLSIEFELQSFVVQHTKKTYKGTSNTNTGRIVVDKIIGITAIHWHTYGEVANNYQLLGWHKVNKFSPAFIYFSDAIRLHWTISGKS